MKPLPKAELLDLHSILRRAAEEAERNGRIEHARKLAQELASIETEIKRAPAP